MSPGRVSPLENFDAGAPENAGHGYDQVKRAGQAIDVAYEAIRIVLAQRISGRGARVRVQVLLFP